ncbi:hypothetical protein [Paenibacillus marinisediminis]
MTVIVRKAQQQRPSELVIRPVAVFIPQAFDMQGSMYEVMCMANISAAISNEQHGSHLPLCGIYTFTVSALLILALP